MDTKLIKIQIRSNSAESWELRNDKKSQKDIRHHELDEKEDGIRNGKVLQHDRHFQDAETQHGWYNSSTYSLTYLNFKSLVMMYFHLPLNKIDLRFILLN